MYFPSQFDKEPSPFLHPDGFGCQPMRQADQQHNASMELLVINNVSSHVTCLHLCKFGTEATCNYIDHAREQEVCTLVHMPADRSMKVSSSQSSWNRTICLETGESPPERCQVLLFVLFYSRGQAKCLVGTELLTAGVVTYLQVI